MADFDFDPEKLKADTEEVNRQKRLLSIMGGIGDTFASSNSVGNFALGKMNGPSTAVSTTANGIADTIQDPLAQQTQMFNTYKQSNDASKMRDENALLNQKKDPNSSASKSLKQIAGRWGIQVTPEMSAYDIEQMIDPKKMMETEAMSSVNFANQKQLREMDHQYNSKEKARDRANDLEKLNLKSQLTQSKEPSGEQYKAAGYAQRMTQSEAIMDELAKKGFDGNDRRSWLNKHLFNEAKPVELQKQEQAQRNFINAVLRRESGAAIAPEEFDNAKQQYFPQAGDTPEVLEQKRRNRLDTLASIKSEAGRAFDAVGRTRSTLEDQTATAYQTPARESGRTNFDLIPKAQAGSSGQPEVKSVGGKMYKRVKGGWEAL